MKMFYYAFVERRDFGNLLTAEGLARLQMQLVPEYKFPDPAHEGEVLSIWTQDPSRNARLPDLLVCKDGTENDWAAWITTFAARTRPFSAYMHLMTSTELKNVARQTMTPELGRLTWPVAGLVLGEVLAASRMADKALETLSATAYASTLSFVMFRASALYPDFQEWTDLPDIWESVRRITGQRTRLIDGKSVARICTIIMQAGGQRVPDKITNERDARLIDVCRELIESPGRPPFGLLNLPFFGDIIDKMSGSREERVVAFEKFAGRGDGLSGSETELMPFAIGYLASRIAPGTIRHSSVLGATANRYPSALLWYGFCAGLGEVELNSPGTTGRQGIDLPPSARRVVRDLLRADPILVSPVCDIGFLELVALSRTGGDPLGGLITTTPGTAIIELVPGVLTTINVSSRTSTERQGLRGRERTVIASLGRQIGRLVETYKELAIDEAVAEEGEQPSLFPSRRKKK